MPTKMEEEQEGDKVSRPHCILCAYAFLPKKYFPSTPGGLENGDGKFVKELFRMLDVEVEDKEAEQLNEKVICWDCFQSLDNSAKNQHRAKEEEERNQKLREELQASTGRLGRLKSRVEQEMSRLGKTIDEGDSKVLPSGGLGLKVRDKVLKVAQKWMNGWSSNVNSKDTQTEPSDLHDHVNPVERTWQAAKSASIPSSSNNNLSAISSRFLKKVEQEEKFVQVVIKNTVQQSIKSPVLPASGRSKQSSSLPPEPKPKRLTRQRQTTPSSCQTRTTRTTPSCASILKRYVDAKLHQTVKVNVRNLTPEEIAKKKRDLKMKKRVVYFGDTSDEEESLAEGNEDDDDDDTLSDADSADTFIQYVYHDSGLSKWKKIVVCALYGKQKFKEEDKEKWQLDFNKSKKQLTYRGVRIRMVEDAKILACGRCRTFKTGCNPTKFWEEITEHVNSVHMEGSGSSVTGVRRWKPKNKDWNPSWDEDEEDEGIVVGKPLRNRNPPAVTVKRTNEEVKNKKVERPQRKRQIPKKYQEMEVKREDEQEETVEKELSGEEEWNPVNQKRKKNKTHQPTSSSSLFEPVVTKIKKAKEGKKGSSSVEEWSSSKDKAQKRSAPPPSAEPKKKKESVTSSSSHSELDCKIEVMEKIAHWNERREGFIAHKLAKRLGKTWPKIVTTNPRDEINVAELPVTMVDNSGLVLECGVCQTRTKKMDDTRFREIILHVLSQHTGMLKCKCKAVFQDIIKAWDHTDKCPEISIQKLEEVNEENASSTSDSVVEIVQEKTYPMGGGENSRKSSPPMQEPEEELDYEDEDSNDVDLNELIE